MTFKAAARHDLEQGNSALVSLVCITLDLEAITKSYNETAVAQDPMTRVCSDFRQECRWEVPMFTWLSLVFGYCTYCSIVFKTDCQHLFPLGGHACSMGSASDLGFGFLDGIKIIRTVCGIGECKYYSLQWKQVANIRFIRRTLMHQGSWFRLMDKWIRIILSLYVFDHRRYI